MTGSVLAERSMTVEAFLAFLDERPKGERWILRDGRPVMNPQPTRRHDWIQTNILIALRAFRKLHRAPWRPSGPSQVPIPGRSGTLAPDVLVAPEGARDDVSITQDPIVVFEILSRSDTFARQRAKLTAYQSVPTIRHYVVVKQDRREVTAYRRVEDGTFVEDARGEVIELSAVGVSLTLADIFDDTPLAT